MTVVTTAMPAHVGGLPPVASGQSVLRQRPIERVAPFRHAALSAANWIVRNCTVEGQPLGKVFPTVNLEVRDEIVDFIEGVCMAGGHEYMFTFPVDTDSYLGTFVRMVALEDALVWPDYAGISVSRRDRRAEVWLYKKGAPYTDLQRVLLYESRLAC